MPAVFELKTIGMREALDTVRLLSMSPADKRRFLSRLGYLAQMQARENTRQQKTVDGTPMHPRSRKSSKTGPMLKHIAKGRWMGVRMIDENQAQVYFPYKLTKMKDGSKKKLSVGEVANQHQQGWRQTVRRPNYPRPFDSSKVPTRLNKERRMLPDGNWCCTANDAAMLIRLDYLPPWLRSGLPAGASASVRYVMRRVSQKQAYFLISEGLARCGESNVTDVTPSRAFLGATPEQRQLWGEILLRDFGQRFKKKNYTNLIK